MANIQFKVEDDWGPLIKGMDVSSTDTWLWRYFDRL